MGSVDDYLDGLGAGTAAIVRGIYARALEIVPDAEQGEGYGMPALRYRGKPLLSVMVAKSHLSLFPFSASVVAAVAPELEGYDPPRARSGSAPTGSFPQPSSPGSSSCAGPRSRAEGGARTTIPRSEGR